MREAIRFTVVEMAGTPYEMGVQHGRQCRNLIQDLARRFDGFLLRPENVEAGRQVAREAMVAAAEHAPQLMEEVRGIADGAGLAVDDVFRLSCSQELNAWQGCTRRQAAATVPTGCTTVAARRDGSALVAWNMDWWRFFQPYLVLLHGRPANGPRFYSFALAGSVGRPGISEQIAVSANYIPYRADADAQPSDDRWAGPGVPYSFIARMLLSCHSTADALALLDRVPRMACLNYTIGDTTGHICCAETLPREYAVLQASEGFLVHANSYHSPALGGMTEEEQRERDPRAFRAREVLRRRGEIDRAAIYGALRSHFPRQPAGVCVHSRPGADAITLLSFVADLREQTLWAAYGPPCRHRYLPYPL